MSEPHWDDVEWSKLTLGSTTLPGAWRVEASAKRNMDMKTSKSRDGAVLNDTGYENAGVTLIGTFTTKKDWAELALALKEIHPRKRGKERHPLAVVHPALNILGITTVWVTEINAPQLGDDGVMEITITCLEWIPEPKVLKKAAPKPISIEQRAANRAVTRGRKLIDANGNEYVDLGIPPPRTSALGFIKSPPGEPDRSLNPEFDP